MISPDDPRLTAYADGALSPEEAVAFERELEGNPEARAEVERLRALQAELREAFAAEDARPPRTQAERVKPRAPGLPGWLHQLAAAVCVVLMAGAVLLPTVGKVRETSRRSVDASNLRQLGQASLIYSVDHQDQMPGAEATDVWDYARLVARDGGLNDATIWVIEADPATGDVASNLRTVLGGDRSALEPAFKKLKPSWAVALGEITVKSPTTTPIAWTRGLQPDGTWAAHSPYGGAGGHVVFLGGNVAFYRDTKNAFTRFDGKGETSNILEALPPGARIAQYEPTDAEKIAWARAERAYQPTRTVAERVVPFVLPAVWGVIALALLVGVVCRRCPLSLLLWFLIVSFLAAAVLLPMIGKVREC